MFKDIVTSREELRALFGSPSERAVQKDRGRLDVHTRAFIARSPFVLIATAGASGSLRRLAQGRRAWLRDRSRRSSPGGAGPAGNNRIDGFTNIVENPHVGLIFLIPGREDTLRVNGRACIVRDEEILVRLEAQGKRPKVAIGVEIEECFLHCAKAFKRSGLWDRERWPDVASLPSMAKILWEQIDLQATAQCSVDDFERDMEDRLRKGLY